MPDIKYCYPNTLDEYPIAANILGAAYFFILV